MVIEQQHLMVQNGYIHDYNKFKLEVPLRRTPLNGDYAAYTFYPISTSPFCNVRGI